MERIKSDKTEKTIKKGVIHRKNLWLIKQKPGGVKGFISATQAVHAHPAGDAVDGVVTAHVFNKHLQLAALRV